MKKSAVNKFPIGSAEHVALHGRRQMKKGKHPSLSFAGIKNPREAFKFASRLAYFPVSGSYLSNVLLDKYVCSECETSGVKLWRMFQTFNVDLLCAKCAAENQKKSVVTIDENGMIESNISGRTDQIGWYIPAVPTEESTPERMIYWGYTSVPGPGVSWWQSLPNFSLEKVSLEKIVEIKELISNSDRVSDLSKKVLFFLIDNSDCISKEVSLTLTENVEGYSAEEIVDIVSGVETLAINSGGSARINAYLKSIGVNFFFNVHYGNRVGSAFNTDGQFAGIDPSKVSRPGLVREDMPLRYTIWLSKKHYSRKSEILVTSKSELEQVEMELS